MPYHAVTSLLCCDMPEYALISLIRPYYALDYACIFFKIVVLFLSVKQQQQLSSSCCVVPATTAVVFSVLFCACNMYLFRFSTHVGLLVSFPFRSSCITYLTAPPCRVFCFVFFLRFLNVFAHFHGLVFPVLFSYPVR